MFEDRDCGTTQGLLDQLEAGLRHVFSYVPKAFHQKIQDQARTDESGDSTILFLKDDLGLDDGHLQKWLSRQNADGSWSDIRYDSVFVSRFPAVEHLRRVRYLARVPQTPEVCGAIKRALAFWFARSPKNANWWWNDFGVPLQLGAILLLAKDYLARETMARGLEVLRSCKIGDWDGQNRVWQAFCVLMRAVLERDVADAESARHALRDELQVGRQGVGLQTDWSYHFHGRLPQFGNYGLSFALTMAQIALAFEKTAWAFSAGELETLATFVDRGLRATLWRGYMDVGSIGRQLNRDAGRLKGVAVEAAVNYLQLAGGHCAKSAPSGLVWFPESACGIFRASDWMASVKCETACIRGIEHGNGDNMLGAHMVDGALFLYATGKEYADIFPLWNWLHIPGVTAYDSEMNIWAARNVIDDLKAEGQIVEFSLDRNGLRAHTCFEFSETGVRVDVSGISTSRQMPVVTTVEQCWACTNASWQKVNGRIVATNGSFRYDLPADAEVRVQHRSGRWSRHMREQDSALVEGDVFEILVRHGMSPKGASCQWSVSRIAATELCPVGLSQTQVSTPAPRILFACTITPGTTNPFADIVYEKLRRLGCQVDFGVDKILSCAPSDYDILQLEWPEALIHWKFDELDDAALATWASRMAAFRAAGCKIAYTRHNTMPHNVQNEKTTRLYQLVDASADAIFHMAEYSHQEFVRNGNNPHAVHYIIPHHTYDCYDRTVPQQQARRRLGIAKDAKVMLVFGAFRNEEEIRLTREAVQCCEVPNLYLLAPQLEGARVSNEELPDYFAAADVVFIQRPRILNSGNLPMAFYFGKVVVGPNVGNVGEILSATGNPVFDPAHVESAAKAISRGFDLVSTGLGARNQQLADREWSANLIARKMLAAYGEMLDCDFDLLPAVTMTGGGGSTREDTKGPANYELAKRAQKIDALRRANDEKKTRITVLQAALDARGKKIEELRCAIAGMREGRDRMAAWHQADKEKIGELRSAIAGMREGRDRMAAERQTDKAKIEELRSAIAGMREERDRMVAERKVERFATTGLRAEMASLKKRLSEALALINE